MPNATEIFKLSGGFLVIGLALSVGKEETEKSSPGKY